MTNCHIHPDTMAAVHGYEIPEKLGFGRLSGPIMFWAEYMDGLWGPGTLEPTRKIELSPSAKVLHYGQEIFEGMKAYRVDQEHPSLFRPERNWKRFNLSARRMAMPEIPQELFMEGVYRVSAYCESLIPGVSGQSLYLRPFMFATEPSLEVTGSDRFAFMVIASPSEAIQLHPMSVLIEREFTRAALGGTGGVKTGGNYAASFASRTHAKSLGFDQSLWLDPNGRRNIEELSVMNFFAVVEGKLFTPTPTGSLLEGVTRSSIIELAEEMGLEVNQTGLNIDELIEQIKDGRCSEAFCCGTAAIVNPICELGEHDGTRYSLANAEGNIAIALKQRLLDIQERRSAGPEGWVHEIPADFYPLQPSAE
jgi:branched-chain amino acid aminotransferase